jgi:hypothetical protein
MAAMMSEHDREITNALKAMLDADAFAPLDADLWPRMRARLEAPRFRPSRIDWALAAAIGAATLMFPQILLGVLYHL